VLATDKVLDAPGWKLGDRDRHEAGPVRGMVRRSALGRFNRRPPHQRWRAGGTDVAHGTISVTATLASLTDQAAE
jgi:hypothetical protein